MNTQGNVHDNNVTEAQAAVLKAVTPLILEMSKEDRGTFIIGNPDLQDNLRAGLALMSKTPAVPVVENMPTLIFLKQTMLGSTSVTVYGLGKRLAFAGMFRAALKLAEDPPVDMIAKLLKERKHVFLSANLDDMLAKQAKYFLGQEGGVDFGLRDGGWANLIPVESPDGTVSVVDARWSGGPWGRHGYSLGYGPVWGRERRLVLSNSDASNL